MAGEHTTPGTALMQALTLPSIERMRERMAMQKAMRQILIEYVRDQMDPTRHFYRISEGDKPALSQDGARNLCTLYEVRVGETLLEERWFDDGHYYVRATLPLYSMARRDLADGDAEVARGVGSCSTKESRYAWRWVWSNDVPGHVTKADLKTRRRGNSVQYRVPNDDLPDLYNTVLKMAEKRAQVAATLRLPGASEIFAEPGHEEETAADDEAKEREELLKLIRRWYRDIPAGGKGKACQAVFGVMDPKALGGLSLEALDAGYALIEQGQVAGLNWKSETLTEDLHRLQRRNAAQAADDLFGDGAGAAIRQAGAPATTPPQDEEPPVEAYTTVTAPPPAPSAAPGPAPSAWHDTLTAHRTQLRMLTEQAVAQKSPDMRALMQLLVAVDTALDTGITATEGLTLAGQVLDWMNA